MRWSWTRDWRTIWGTRKRCQRFVRATQICDTRTWPSTTLEYLYMHSRYSIHYLHYSINVQCLIQGGKKNEQPRYFQLRHFTVSCYLLFSHPICFCHYSKPYVHHPNRINRSREKAYRVSRYWKCESRLMLLWIISSSLSFSYHFLSHFHLLGSFIYCSALFLSLSHSPSLFSFSLMQSTFVYLFRFRSRI